MVCPGNELLHRECEHPEVSPASEDTQHWLHHPLWLRQSQVLSMFKRRVKRVLLLMGSARFWRGRWDQKYLYVIFFLIQSVFCSPFYIQTIYNKLLTVVYSLYGDEFEQAPGVVDGQGGLGYCSPWGLKESDMTEWLNWFYLWELWFNFILCIFYYTRQVLFQR